MDCFDIVYFLLAAFGFNALFYNLASHISANRRKILLYSNLDKLPLNEQKKYAQKVFVCEIAGGIAFYLSMFPFGIILYAVERQQHDIWEREYRKEQTEKEHELQQCRNENTWDI